MDDEKATATEQELFELSEKDIYKFTQEFVNDHFSVRSFKI